MNPNLIEAVKEACGRYRDAGLALPNLDAKERELIAEREIFKARVDKLPPESISVLGEDGRPFDVETRRLLSSLSDIQIKLDLLPGIRVRCRAEQQGLAIEIRRCVKALIADCLKAATAKLDKDQSDLAAHLAPLHGGNLDRARAAASLATEPNRWAALGGVSSPCEAWTWRETFAYRAAAADPLQDGESAIRLAESFDRFNRGEHD